MIAKSRPKFSVGQNVATSGALVALGKLVSQPPGSRNGTDEINYAWALAFRPSPLQ